MPTVSSGDRWIYKMAAHPSAHTAPMAYSLHLSTTTFHEYTTSSQSCRSSHPAPPSAPRRMSTTSGTPSGSNLVSPRPRVPRLRHPPSGSPRGGRPSHTTLHPAAVLAAAGPATTPQAAAVPVVAGAATTLPAAVLAAAGAVTTLRPAAVLAAAGPATTLRPAAVLVVAGPATTPRAAAVLAAAGAATTLRPAAFLAAAVTVVVHDRRGGLQACHDYRLSHPASPARGARIATCAVAHTATRLVVQVPFPRRSVPGRRRLFRASQRLGRRRCAPGLGAQERRAVAQGVAADDETVPHAGDPRPGSGAIPTMLFRCADAGVAHRHGLRAVVRGAG
jgi:hypothetical protein